MVFFNYATMQMAAKIVYYGPGLCGKTTNLHYIYAKTSPQSRGEMVSLETETDRTLFFDLLPIDVGVIGGFKTRLQLYTIPGQVFYNTTRKLVLKGVDGVVFVADSQTAMLEANADSFRNLEENLREIGVSLDELPLVIQLNKRDLPNAADPKAILGKIDPEGKYEWTEASAVTGAGVFETLKLVSKLTLKTLRKRMMGDEPVREKPSRKPVFQVHDRPAAPAAAAAPPAPPAQRPAPPAPLPERTADPAATLSEARPVALPPQEPASSPATAAANTAAAVAEAAPETNEPLPEPEVDFKRTAKPAASPEDEVRHVKVRSSVDVMAELESLRKKATEAAPKPKRSPAAALHALAAMKPRKEISRAFSLEVPSNGASPRKVRLSVAFEDSESQLIQQQDQSIELEKAADLQNLLLNVKIDFNVRSKD